MLEWYCAISYRIFDIIHAHFARETRYHHLHAKVYICAILEFDRYVVNLYGSYNFAL